MGGRQARAPAEDSHLHRHQRDPHAAQAQEDARAGGGHCQGDGGVRPQPRML